MSGLALLLLTQGLWAAERPPISAERLALVRDVTEVRISPDGGSVAIRIRASGRA